MDGYAVDQLSFDPADCIFVANSARLGHQIHGNIVVNANDDPLGDIFVTQFPNGAVGEDIEGLFDER